VGRASWPAFFGRQLAMGDPVEDDLTYGSFGPPNRILL
jgi:hypothetical protein